jgi:catechol 2,3-dioxygenase-like lactoylglutathione lyase family enzyme
MLSESTVTTMLPVVDMSRARAFYEGKLGFRADGPKPDGKVLYHPGGATLALFPRDAATKAEHTAVSFEVRDIDSTVRQLEQAGVKFEDYDMPGLKTEKHICVLGAEKAAWFYDTEGNCLCVHEESA